MIIRCYSVYDRKAQVFHAPYYAPTDGAAVRTFSDAVADPNSMLGRHPNDYVLYFVGTFDDSRALMEPKSPVDHVIDASSLVKALQAEIPFPDSLTTTKPSELDGRYAEDRL